MTQLAATQLPHCSIMSENEIDLKILRWPGRTRRDYYADCTNTVSLPSPSLPP